MDWHQLKLNTVSGDWLFGNNYMFNTEKTNLLNCDSVSLNERGNVWIWKCLSTQRWVCGTVHDWDYIIHCFKQVVNNKSLSPLCSSKWSSSELSWLGSWNLMQPEVGVDKPSGEFWNHIAWKKNNNHEIQSLPGQKQFYL